MFDKLKQFKLLSLVVLSALFLVVIAIVYSYFSNKQMEWSGEIADNTSKPANIETSVVTEKLTNDPDDQRMQYELTYPIHFQANINSYNLPCVIDDVDYFHQAVLNEKYMTQGRVSCYYLDVNKKQQQIFFPAAINNVTDNSFWLIGAAANEPGTLGINSVLVEAFYRDLFKYKGPGHIVLLHFNFPSQDVLLFQAEGFAFDFMETYYTPEMIEQFVQTGYADLLPNKTIIPLDINFDTALNEQ